MMTRLYWIHLLQVLNWYRLQVAVIRWFVVFIVKNVIIILLAYVRRMKFYRFLNLSYMVDWIDYSLCTWMVTIEYIFIQVWFWQRLRKKRILIRGTSHKWRWEISGRLECLARRKRNVGDWHRGTLLHVWYNSIGDWCNFEWIGNSSWKRKTRWVKHLIEGILRYPCLWFCRISEVVLS